jgi:hypothetical protein
MRINCAIITTFLLIPMPVLAEWEAPPNADAAAILKEAKADIRSGQYRDALAKHVWFHNRALEIDRSYFGVRLTTALASWHRLAKAYPPALEALKQAREHAAKRVLQDKDKIRDAFIDVVAINEQLDEEDETVSLFKKLDSESPTLAGEVYDLAQTALIRAKHIQLCGKYLAPERAYQKLKQIHDLGVKFAAELDTEAAKRDQREIVEQAFLDESATLIALLVLNDRKPEAEKIAQDARDQLKISSRNVVIDASLMGKFPESVLLEPNKGAK